MAPSHVIMSASKDTVNLLNIQGENRRRKEEEKFCIFMQDELHLHRDGGHLRCNFQLFAYIFKYFFTVFVHLFVVYRWKFILRQNIKEGDEDLFTLEGKSLATCLI